MKILLGSHGTGKTTLLKEVSKRYENYYVTDGFSRPVIKIGKKLDFSDNEKQIAINELSTWAYQNYLSHKNVISTRSIIDCIIYTQILAPTVDVSEMIELFKNTVSQVEYVFYVPIEFEVKEDDKDRLGVDLQKEIDILIKNFIKEYIPEEKVILITGSVEERLNQISKFL